MEFFDVLAQRRTCRDFTPEPVSDDQIMKLITACQWAPSPLHLQPWEFLIVTEAEVKQKIKSASEQARQAVADAGGPGWAAKYGMDFIEDAPVLMVLLYNPAKGGLGDYFNQSGGALMAASAAVENLLLAATDMGLGAVWFTFFDPQQMKTVLNIPEAIDIAGIMPLGRPKGQPKAPPRKPPKIHRELYGQDQ